MTTMNPTLTSRGSAISDQELMTLESEYWDAVKDRDALTVGRLTAEECTLAGARGVSAVDAREMGKLIEAATHRIIDYRIDPKTTRITHLSDDLVAIAYRVHEDLEVDGKPVQLDAFDVSVWKKSDTGWTCVLHTESIAGDPFGRDRLAGVRPS
jgi:ketosteroid isomerase-like protein